MSRRMTMIAGGRLLLLLVAAVVAAPGLAAAATFHVDSEVDAVDANPGDGLCETDAGVCTLRAAVMEANVLPGADRIELPAGVYELSVSGPPEEVGANGDLDLAGPVDIVGAGDPADTVVDAGGLSSVFTVWNPYDEVAGLGFISLANLTVRNGDPFGLGLWGFDFAGRMSLTDVVLSHNRYGLGRSAGIPLVVTDSVIERNLLSGISMMEYFAPVEVMRTVIRENGREGIYFQDAFRGFYLIDSLVFHNGGGGVALTSETTATIRGSTIADNASGGLWLSDAYVRMENSTIDGNSGGAAGIRSSCGALEAAHVTVSDNTGGISSDECGWITIEDSFISHNHNDTGCAAIDNYGTLDIRRSTISGNTVDNPTGDADAVICNRGFDGELRMTNVTVSGNVSSGVETVRGGAILNEDTAMLSAVTLHDNEAVATSPLGESIGGGLYNLGQLTLENSIVAGNRAGSGPDCAAATPLLSGGHNVLGNRSGCAASGSGGTDLVGDPSSPIDARLGPLARSGGFAPTHVPLAGSPALNLVPVASCTYDDDGDAATPRVPLSVDQRGVARPQGAKCDAGAVEFAEQCRDGIDNDGDGRKDFDGGASAGLPASEQTEPDPHCDGPGDDREASGRRQCGLGFELVLLTPLLGRLARRKRSGSASRPRMMKVSA